MDEFEKPKIICDQCKFGNHCAGRYDVQAHAATFIDDHSDILFDDPNGNQKEYMINKIMETVLSRCKFVDHVVLMDTSIEGFEMCGKSVEIQEIWKPNLGDYVAKETSVGFTVGIINAINWSGFEWVANVSTISKEVTFFPSNSVKHDLTFIPRQDQLWNLFELPINRMADILSDFERFVSKHTCPKMKNPETQDSVFITKGRSIVNPTIEQMLLCFFMEVKFNKKWNGNGWRQ